MSAPRGIRRFWLILSGPLLMGLYLVIQLAVSYLGIFSCGWLASDGADPLAIFHPGPQAEAAMELYNQNILWMMLAFELAGLAVFGLWWLLAVWRKRNRRLQPAPWVGHGLGALVLGLSMQLLLGPALQLADRLFPQTMEQYNQLMESAGIGQFSWLNLLAVALVAPLVEEVIFRGLILHFTVRGVRRFWLANLIQAACFGIMHMNLVQGIYAFALGLLLGWVWQKHHRLRWCVLMHVGVNASSYLMGWLPDAWWLMPVLIGMGVALLFVGLWLLGAFEGKGYSRKIQGLRR